MSVLEATNLLQVGIDALCAIDPAQLGDAESVVLLHRQLARIDAVTTRATAAFDASGAWEPSGARNAAAWMADACRPRRQRG